MGYKNWILIWLFILPIVYGYELYSDSSKMTINGNKGIMESYEYKRFDNSTGTWEEINNSFYECTEPTSNVKKYCHKEYTHYTTAKQNGIITHKQSSNDKNNISYQLSTIGGNNIFYSDYQITHGGLESEVFGIFKHYIVNDYGMVKESMIINKKVLLNNIISYSITGNLNLNNLKPYICDTLYYDCENELCDYPVPKNCVDLEVNQVSNVLSYQIPEDWANNENRTDFYFIDPSILYNFNNVSWDGHIYVNLLGGPTYTRNGTSETISTGLHINSPLTICDKYRGAIDFKINDAEDIKIDVYDARLTLGHGPQAGAELEVHITHTKPKSFYVTSPLDHFTDINNATAYDPDGEIYAKKNLSVGSTVINISGMIRYINDSLKGKFQNQFSTGLVSKNDTASYSCFVNQNPLAIISSETQSIPQFNNHRPRLTVYFDLLCEPPTDGSHWDVNVTCVYSNRTVDMTGNLTLQTNGAMVFLGDNTSMNITKETYIELREGAILDQFKVT